MLEKFGHRESGKIAPKDFKKTIEKVELPKKIDPSIFKLAGWDIIEEGAKAVIPEQGKSRLKSAQRFRIEAEVEVIKKKIGSLESIRSTLGLSQRKMAQLLFVDPSAWTRWTRDGDEAPPHIYRMLQWYLALAEKYPSLDVNFWLNGIARHEDPSQDVADLKRQVEALSVRLGPIQKDQSQDKALAESLQRELDELGLQMKQLKMSVRKRVTTLNAIIGLLAAGTIALSVFILAKG